MIRVEIRPEMLRWALRRVSPSEEIPEKLRKKFPKLPEWLDGTSQPTLRQLEDFSRATFTPFGYFFLSEPPEERLPIPLFRTMKEDSIRSGSPHLLEVVQTMERRQAWMREYLLEQGAARLSFVRSVDRSASPEQMAQQIRKTLGLQEDWASQQGSWTEAFRELRNRAEQIGILTAASSTVGNNPHRPLDPKEFRGFVLVDEYAPLVFINTADFRAAQMFTLAHELAHIWIGSSAAFDLRDFQPAPDETERRCDAAAAELLVPAHQLRKIWPNVQREVERFEQIARHFKVSEIVAARRALDLGLIQKPEFFHFLENYRELSSPLGSPKTGYFYATQLSHLGRRFAETLIRAVHEGTLLYHEAYRLTGMYGKTFDSFVSYFYSKSP